MTAAVLSLSDEVESRHWDDVVEHDLLLGQAYVRRAQAVWCAWASGRAAGRADFVVCEVAAALCLDERSAQVLLDEARLLAELPSIGDAVQDGQLGLPHARVLLAELLPLDTAVALEVLGAVLPKAPGRTPAQLLGVVRRAVVKADADAAARRRRAALRERRVFRKPEPDGLALFGAYLAAEDAIEAYRLVDDRAASYAPDERCADERRADALLDLLRGGGRGATRQRLQADVVVPVDVGLSISDAPCDLLGYGVIDAEHARELLTDADLRKVCADSRTGEVLAVATSTTRPSTPAALRAALLDMVLTPTPWDDDTVDTYRPTAAQRRVAIRRDRTCAFPSCSVPAGRCDLDHRRPWPRGETALHNLTSASRRHHRAKQAGWTPGPLPDGALLWTSPCGRSYYRPPPHEPPDPVDPDATLPPV